MDVMETLDKCALATKESRINISLDITFHDICYTAKKGKKPKNILHQMSGTFKSGQLTAILGPSGAGKSSLMNILAGLKTRGVDGRIEMSGVERDLKTFHKQSAYIEQYDHLLQNLSVEEYMDAAARLKLGIDITDGERKSKVESIVKTLGLSNSTKTRISCLSGGERKRLSIGLELFDDPYFLFLDEPTSGLDSSSSLQCVGLLREIARRGRTVVTTIHQPSSHLLDHFDHLYIVADGLCIYQGPVKSLVPYLQTFNLQCPKYHNPANFVMDVASGDYGDVLPQLVSGVENGRLIYSESSALLCTADSLDTEENHRMNKSKELSYAIPFHNQVAILLERTWRTIWREKMLTQVRFTTHVAFGIFFGMVYQAVGNDAGFVLNNIGLLYISLIFIVFTSVMPTVVTFPLERRVVFREHQNHWYSLKAYYLAKLLVDIPFQIIFPTVFLTIVYLMSNQPMSMDRFSMLLCITICIALVGQGIGLVVGAAFDIQSAAFLAPVFAIPFLLFAGFFINLNAIPSYLMWMSYVSFFRYGFVGSMLSIYDYDRPPLNCSQPYCHYRLPDKLLEQYDMADCSYSSCIVGMLVYFVVLRLAGYIFLRLKLKSIL
ncbi:ATP-binding cassette sub-family G member 1-like isoform X2 [Daphnia carinata]|uniref:ATP-binding cassette sub-family G member 1-like isoform X2 n=1 Tax=Daphnia carinata TaxID=120202 RepID=UPI00257A7359|nr:ATP-binding cassette sub-family G member 1-like isoform X2 [Daphnia carinata]